MDIKSYPGNDRGATDIEGMSEAERFRLEQQASFFSQATDIHGDLPSAYLYWSQHFVEPHLKELFGVSEAVGFYASCIKDHASRSNSKGPLRIASIGCGEARAEIDLCKRLSAMGIHDVNFICVDIATGAIQRAQEAAHREGVAAQFSFVVMDFNEFFRGAKFDVVIAHQVLHHVVDLETLFESIKASIGDDGIFLTVDMIGRNGHMLWPEALAIFDQFWKLLPREYKFNHGFGRYEDTFSNWDHSKEGNEGIRAQDVLSNLTKRFAFDRFFATGCLAPTLFGRQFGANFDPNKPEDREIIDTIGRIDHDLMDVGYLKPVLMYAMMSTHQIEPPRNYRQWSAAFCCRQPEDYALFYEKLNYALGVVLNFGERKSINAFLSQGWSSPEPSGVWSNDNRSLVTIPLLYPAPPVDLVLTIEGVGHVCPEKPLQTVEVTVNGSQVGHMVFKQAGYREQFKLQLGRMAKGETEISIGFQYSDTRSPVELGVSNDIRRIAFFLQSMMISPK